MSAPGRRSLVCSVGKLSGSFQRIVLTRVRLSLRKGEGEGAGWLAASGALSMARTPHHDPLPLAKGRSERATKGPTTAEHYHTALKSYSRFTCWRGMIRLIRHYE